MLAFSGLTENIHSLAGLVNTIFLYREACVSSVKQSVQATTLHYESLVLETLAWERENFS